MSISPSLWPGHYFPGAGGRGLPGGNPGPCRTGAKAGSFTALGRPRPGVLLSSGNIDSMVARCTSGQKRRHEATPIPRAIGPACGPTGR
ncbi:MAG: hypothetical protein ACLRWQ_07530 [Flavonifractor plautii]